MGAQQRFAVSETVSSCHLPDSVQGRDRVPVMTPDQSAGFWILLLIIILSNSKFHIMLVKYKPVFDYSKLFLRGAPPTIFPVLWCLGREPCSRIYRLYLALDLVERYLYLYVTYCIYIYKQSARCCKPYAGDNSKLLNLEHEKLSIIFVVCRHPEVV